MGQLLCRYGEGDVIAALDAGRGVYSHTFKP
jgi:hypothetical protein